MCHILSAFMPDSSERQAQEITEPMNPVANETFYKFDDRYQEMQRHPSEERKKHYGENASDGRQYPPYSIRCPACTCQEDARADYAVYDSHSRSTYLDRFWGWASYMRSRV